MKLTHYTICTVTEPKFLNTMNEEASSDLTGSSDEVKQASYRDSNDTDLKDIGEPPYSDDDLLHSIPPILDQLERHEPGRSCKKHMHVQCAIWLKRTS